MIPLEFTTFIGRFHPLFVHLPIGFLLLAILLEWYEKYTKTDSKSKLVPYAWFLGGISAAIAALCGWYLGETGLYREEDLFVHRWLGIALVVASFLGWYVKKNREKSSSLVQNGFNILLLGMLFVEGHKGGNLTHGDSYLTEYAPEPLQKLLGAEVGKDSLPEFSTPDSVQLYNDLVYPVFETKCIACHNDEVQRGGLNMATTEAFQVGGDNGPIVIAGNSLESELFHRITLPQRNIKFMPPTEETLTYDEIKVVEWWIEQGASFEDRIVSVAVTETIKPVLLRRYGLDTSPKPWYEMVQLPFLDSGTLTAIENQGFVVKSLGGDNPLLDIAYSGNDLTREQLNALENVKEYITWLSLAGTNVQDEWLSMVANFPNLTRLQLEKTTISDKGIQSIKGLEHLEALNLYGTRVSDSSLAIIGKLKELQRVYLWNTRVTLENAKRLEESKEGLEVVIGENF
ncbi:hypothetical protein FK220_016675 [Flavobacteriaceae bacterium TP-CH-4]|uniref:Planctomycete cytochrome C n=1 Tax=Pelagihabitans pacificus TaxID=2696054 RepID=A0A967AXJ1_9FLAO|nr:c-type cytochrome domain-containing protein [Pelagihabitans pacificus]NHF60988.1 hypothetical protein [Pelagihabitans pacificus]